MDLTLVLHSRDISAIGLGDITDPLTCAGPTNTVPEHLLANTITLRFEIFSDQCPLASQNLSFVANRHLLAEEDVAGAVEFAKENAKFDPSMATGKSSSVLPLGLKETAVHRVDKAECIEFGTSVTDSVFGGTYIGENMAAAAVPSPFSQVGSSATSSPADGAGFLVVSNFGGPNTNASRYFITLRPMKEIVGNHTVIGRIRAPHPKYLGGIGNGFERLAMLLKHPQFKINAKTCIPLNKLAIADCVVVSIPHLPNSNAAAFHADPNAADMGANGRKSRLAGKLRGREDEEEAEMLREDFEKGLNESGGAAGSSSSANPFANPAAFAGFDMNNFGAADARVRTTKKRRAEAPLLATASLSLAEQERLRTVAVPMARHFEGHDDDANSDDDEGNGSGIPAGAFDHYLRKKVFGASVSTEDLQASFRPVGVNPNQMAPSTFNLFEANAMTYSSDLRDVLEQQLERQHNRERRMTRKQKALEKQKQGKLGGLGGGGAETAASAALKAALAATAAAAQLSTAGGHGSKANKAKSAVANVSDKLGRIREKYSANGAQFSVKAFQERAKAKSDAGKARTKKY